MTIPKQDLLTKVETLRNMMVSRATGGGSFSNEAEYVSLRRELLSVETVKKRLPRVVVTCHTLGDFWGVIQPKFETYKERRAFLRDEFAPLLNFLEAKQDVPADQPITSSLKNLAPDDIHVAWEKALERREQDPEGAITAARTLVESTCKFILDQQAVVYEDDADLPKLYQTTAKTLNLAPEQHHDEVFRRILGGCQSVVNGLGTLRNKWSDAHGRSPGRGRPAARHAALAVNLAGSMAMFLVETFQARTA